MISPLFPLSAWFGGQFIFTASTSWSTTMTFTSDSAEKLYMHGILNLTIEA